MGVGSERRENEVDRDMNNQRFEAEVEVHLSGRAGIRDLMEWLDQTDFYDAPASGRYHGAYPGGLVDHSLAVLDQLRRVNAAWEMGLDEGSMVVCALFHDLCKADFYRPDTRNVKDDRGVWHKVPCYTVAERYHFGGHGSKSVYLLMSFIKLSPEEAAAINCHMGQFDATAYSKPAEVFADNPLAWALHVADEAATYLDER